MKKMFIKSLVMIDEDINNTAMQVIEENIMNNVMWIKKDRSYKKHIDIYSIVALIFFHNALFTMFQGLNMFIKRLDIYISSLVQTSNQFFILSTSLTYWHCFFNYIFFLFISYFISIKVIVRHVLLMRYHEKLFLQDYQ